MNGDVPIIFFSFDFLQNKSFLSWFKNIYLNKLYIINTITFFYFLFIYTIFIEEYTISYNSQSTSWSSVKKQNIISCFGVRSER